MYLPSEEVYKELRWESGGIWFVPTRGSDTHAILLKSHTNVLKSLFKGASIKVGFGLENTPKGRVLLSVMYIYDDTESPIINIGPNIHYTQQVALLEILRDREQTPIFFYDELARNVASAQCRFGVQRLEAVSLFDDLKGLYVGEPTPYVIQALGQFERTANDFLKLNPIALEKVIIVELALEQFQEYDIHVVGDRETGFFNIAQKNEGNGLEQSVWHLLVGLFGSDIYWSPQVVKGKKTRELTDILATTDLGIFLIESKSKAVMSIDQSQTKERKVKSIESHIEKGLGQLVGAIKSIRDGRSLLTSENEEIIINRELVPHGIVLVSEMFPFMNGKALLAQLAEASLKSNAMLHIIDLTELAKLVTASKTANILDHYLMQRFEQVIEKENVFVRTNFIKE